MRTIGRKILIKKDEDQSVTAGGIIMVRDSSVTTTGSVVSAPEKIATNGVLIDSGLKTGDKVLFAKNQAFEISVDGERLQVVDFDNVIGVV